MIITVVIGHCCSLPCFWGSVSVRDPYRGTFKYSQAKGCDLAGLQGIERGNPMLLVVAEIQTESETHLALLGGLLDAFLFSFGCFWKRGEDPTAFF